MKSIKQLIWAWPILAVSSIAFAHPETGSHSLYGMNTGFLHPLTGLDHLLAMVAIGALSVTRSAGKIWHLPATFLFGMFIGGIAGLLGAQVPSTETVILGSMIVLGAALLFKRTLSVRLDFLVVLFFGLAHGHAHGFEIPSAAHPIIYVLGFMTTTTLLHLSGILAGTALRETKAGSLLMKASGLAMLVTGFIWLS